MYTYLLLIAVLKFDEKLLVDCEDDMEVAQMELAAKNELIREMDEGEQEDDFDFASLEKEEKELDQVYKICTERGCQIDTVNSHSQKLCQTPKFSKYFYKHGRKIGEMRSKIKSY